MKIKTPTKLMLFNFCILVAFYIYLWVFTLNQYFFHHCGKTPYIIFFFIYSLIGLALYKIWFALINKNKDSIIISGLLSFLTSFLFYMQPDQKWFYNVSFLLFLYLGFSFIIHSIRIKKNKDNYLNDVPKLVAELKKLGFKVKSYSDSPEAFGNFIVSFTDGKFSFKFTKDRSQYILEGTDDKLEKYGLNKAFDEKDEFQKKLLIWLKEQSGK